VGIKLKISRKINEGNAVRLEMSRKSHKIAQSVPAQLT